MSNKYARPPKKEPKYCSKQSEIDKNIFELKVFNFLKENLDIKIEKIRNQQNHNISIITICLKNPITNEIEEINREYD